MIDLMSWSLPLGRWFGAAVRLHVLFLIFAASWLLDAIIRAKSIGPSFVETFVWLLLLLAAVALREGFRAYLANRLCLPLGTIRLWPAGNLIGPTPHSQPRSIESAVLPLVGLLTSLGLALSSWISLWLAGSRPVLWPFGGAYGGTPTWPSGQPVAAYSAIWWIGWFGFLNWVIFCVNLIPALPFDCGGVVRALGGRGYREHDTSAYWSRAFAIVLGLVGVFRLYFKKPGGLELICLALIVEWLVRHEARVLEESGFLDDGLFGYDFSQGYTSLESGASLVRPKKESALKRWRQRRSDLRRERREAQEAAESARMDQILEKLYREGRAALSDEENRFLVRVSAKYRHKRLQGS